MELAIPEPLIRLIRRKFCCEPDDITVLSGGFSGTPLFRFSTGSENWVARGWPCSAETLRKVDDWSKVSRHLQQCSDDLKPFFNSSPIPQPEPWLLSDGKPSLVERIENALWTLARWVPGEPLKGKDVTSDLLRGYVQQLGRWHLVSRRLHSVSDVSKGLRDRYDMLRGIDKSCMMIANSCTRHPLGSDLARFLVFIEVHRKSWIDGLCRMISTPCEQHWIVRDLWRENLLVDQQQRWIYTVDIGASRIDWPAFDFVRLVGSLSGFIQPDNSIDLWQAFWECYRQENPIADATKAIDLKIVHEVSTTISIAYWFNRLNEPNTAPLSFETGITRMAELLQTLVVND